MQNIGKLGWIRRQTGIPLVCEHVAEPRDPRCVTTAGGQVVAESGPNHVRCHPDSTLLETRRSQ